MEIVSPTLHEFFENLYKKLDSALEPLPNKTAEKSAEQIEAILLGHRMLDERSQGSQKQLQEVCYSYRIIL
jgi:hypothetical protein